MSVFRGELDEAIVELLSNFVFELLIDDELEMARLLRKKLLSKQSEKNKAAEESPLTASLKSFTR